jgi:TolB protein
MADEYYPADEDQKPTSKFTSIIILAVIGLILVVAAVIFYPQAKENRVTQAGVQTPSPQLETPLPASATPSPTAEIIIEPDPEPAIYAQTSQFGNLVLSIREGSDAHLFAYSPFLENAPGGLSALPLTRITSGPYQDIAPEVSPDGHKIAFASNRNGPWDIYILDLTSGEISQFTDSLSYDGNPTWSPDGMWLAYESYHLDNLDIFIQSLEENSSPIPLTNNPAADFSPDWSGQGRRISFVSTRSGDQAIWYADLDSPQEDKAIPLPNLPGQSADHPCWTEDGRYLTWTVTTTEGIHVLVTWDSEQPELDPRPSGSGDWPAWGGEGEILYTLIKTPEQDFLTAYPGLEGDFQVMMPAVELPGVLEGMSWVKTIYLDAALTENQEPLPTPLWEPAQGGSSQNRQGLIQLRNLEAPHPQFIQDAASSFSQLREEIRSLAGWDFLASLEDAYLGLGEPQEPGVNLNWLHTGRGIMLDDIPRLAGWVVVYREQFGEETYWRVYIRANNQQGLQGKPLRGYPWDFNARYSGSNTAYENGGQRAASVPSGYWVDFSEIAGIYGWMRFPAETFWQFSETASRYQYFAFKQGLSLEEALLLLHTPDSIKGLIDTP